MRLSEKLHWWAEQDEGRLAQVPVAALYAASDEAEALEKDVAFWQRQAVTMGEQLTATVQALSEPAE